MRQRRDTSPETMDAKLLAFIRGLEGAKSFRAAMLHYTRVREQNGAGVAVTDDAELHAYKQAFSLYEEMQRKLRKSRQ
jgi:hypothetical protein